MFIDFSKDNFARLTDVRARFDVVFFVDVCGGVLNGDPDNGARARTDPETGHGIATDVCAKRVLRDNVRYLIDNGYEAVCGKVPGNELYVAPRAILNENHQRVYKEAGIQSYGDARVVLSGPALAELVVDGLPVALPESYTVTEEAAKDGTEWALRYDGSLDAEGRMAALKQFATLGKDAKKVAEKLTKGAKAKTIDDATLQTLTHKLCDIYYDVRTFGAVATTGDSCGAVRGPWQVVQGTTIDPLVDLPMAITRNAITRVEDAAEMRQTMGRRAPCPYALYRFTSFFSPTLAGRTHFSEADLKLFWTALLNFGQEHKSSLRGHVEPAGIYVFAHDHPMGRAHAHELFDRVRAVRTGPTDKSPHGFGEYRIFADDAAMPKGVELVRLYERPVPSTDEEVAARVTAAQSKKGRAVAAGAK